MATTSELCSWKQIAAYLGVSVKTAQIWEHERGLPVRRLPGPRGHVWASTTEIDAWKSGSGSTRAPEVPPPAPSEPGVPDRKVSARPRWPWVAFIAAAAVGVVFAVVRLPKAGSELVAVVPITTAAGAERVPDIRPDGTSVVFLSDGPDGGILHHQAIPDNDAAGGASSILTTGVAGYPRWSPDGTRVSYSRPDVTGVRLVVRNIRDGAESPLTRFAGGKVRAENQLSSLMTDWLSDSAFVISDRPAPEKPYCLMAVDKGGSRKVLSAPPGDIEGDLQPAVSPDGSKVAFVRQFTFSEADVFIISSDGGAAKRVTNDHARIDGIAWLNYRELLVASVRTTGMKSLWRMDASGGTPQLLSGAAGAASNPRVARIGSGPLAVYQNERRDNNIWLASADGSPKRVAGSTWTDFNPSFSPDGVKFAFISKRTGYNELWTSNTDGTGETQITHLQRGFTDSPRWSPDKAWIAFTSVDGKNRDVYVVPSGGGTVRRITTWESEEGRPNWSPDSKTIYFRSDRSGSRELWRTGFPDGGTAQVTTTGAYEAAVAPDGSIYLIRDRDMPGLWRHSAGKPPELLIGGVREGRWSLAPGGILFQDFPGREIIRYDSSTRRKALLLALPGTAPIIAGMSAHPKLSSVLYGQTDEDSADIMLARLSR